MLRFILIFIFIVFWQLKAFSSEVDSIDLREKWLEEAILQFKELYAYNKRNDSLGLSHRNKYLFVYQPKQKLEYDNEGNIYFNLYTAKNDNGEPDNRKPIFDETLINSLDSKLQDFNGAGNQHGVKIYGFVYQDLYLNIHSDFLSKNTDPVSPIRYFNTQINLPGASEEKFAAANKSEYNKKLRSKINQKISSLGISQDVLIYFAYSWSSQHWKSELGNVFNTYFGHGWRSLNPFILNHAGGRAAYWTQQLNLRDYPDYATKKSMKAVFNAICSEIEYIQDENLQAINDKDCAHLLADWVGHPMVTDPNHPYYDIIWNNPCALKNMNLDAFALENQSEHIEKIENGKCGSCVYMWKKSALIDKFGLSSVDKEIMVDKFAGELYKLIVDSDNGNGNFIYSDNLSKEEKEVYNDRLLTYSNVVGKRIFIVEAKLSGYLLSEKQQSFTESVIQKVEEYLGKSFDIENDLFICLPFFQHIYLRCDEQLPVYPLYFNYEGTYGLAASSINLNETVREGSTCGESIYQSRDSGVKIHLNEIYKQIEKPYIPLNYYFFRDGEIVCPLSSEVASNPERGLLEEKYYKTGYSKIFDYNVYFDKEGIKTIYLAAATLKRINEVSKCQEKEDNGEEIPIECIIAESKFESQILNLVKTAKNIGAEGLEKFKDVRLKESKALEYADAYTNTLISKIYGDDFLKQEFSNQPNIPADALWPEDVKEKVLAIIDAAGAVLSLFQLDIVADAAGFLYSTYRGDLLNASLYGTAVLVFDIPAIALKPVAQGGKQVVYGGAKRFTTANSDELVELVGEVFNVDRAIAQGLVSRGNEFAALMRSNVYLDVIDNLDEPTRRAFLTDLGSPEGQGLYGKFLEDPNVIGPWEILYKSSDEAGLRVKRLDRDVLNHLKNDLRDFPGLESFIKNKGDSGLLAWKIANDAYPQNDPPPSIFSCLLGN